MLASSVNMNTPRHSPIRPSQRSGDGLGSPAPDAARDALNGGLYDVARPRVGAQPFARCAMLTDEVPAGNPNADVRMQSSVCLYNPIVTGAGHGFSAAMET